MAPLKTIRRRKLITMVELAERSGVSTRTLARIEKGEHLPTITTIKKLQRVLEVDAEDVDEFKAAIFKGVPMEDKE